MAVVLQHLDINAQLEVHQWTLVGLDSHREPLNSLAHALDETTQVPRGVTALTPPESTASDSLLLDADSLIRSNQLGLGDVLYETWSAAVARVQSSKEPVRLNVLYERTHEVLQRSANDWLYNPDVASRTGPAVVHHIQAALQTWSLFFRSLSENVQNADELDGQRFALSLELLVEKLETLTEIPVHDPPVGTLGAVVTTLADAALSELDSNGSLIDILVTSTDAALTELERGPIEHDQLSESGVVDPAAASVLVLLDQFISVVAGEIDSVSVQDGTAQTEADVVSSPLASRETAVPLSVLRCQLYPHEGATIETQSWVETQLFPLAESLTVILGERSSGSFLQIEIVTAELGATVEQIAKLGELREVNIALVATSLTQDG